MPAPRALDPARQGDPGRTSIPAVPLIQGREVHLTEAEKQRRYRAGYRTTRRGLEYVWSQPRNGLPEHQGYTWHRRRYPWAEHVLAAAEAVHGPPKHTCYCGAPVHISDGRVIRCDACGRTSRDDGH